MTGGGDSDNREFDEPMTMISIRKAAEANPPPPPPSHRIPRNLPAAAVLAVLAAPPAAAAQNCTAGYGGDMPDPVYSSAVPGGIVCDELTGGLTLTVEKGVMIGTETDLPNPGIYVDGKDFFDAAYGTIDADDVGDTDSAGDNDITVINSGTVYGTTRGISAVRDGTGKLRIEHRAGKIVLITGQRSRGINAYHGGKAGLGTKGIEIVSAADIDLSAATGDVNAIFTNTVSSPAGTTIPVTINVTDGTIKTGGNKGSSIYANQHAKGKVAVNIAGGVTIDSTRSGIRVERCSNFRSCEAKAGDIEVTAAKGSVIKARQASYQAPGHGIYLRQRGSGDIKVEAGGRIEAEDEAVFVRHLLGTSTGDVTVTLTKDSVIEARKGIDALTIADGDITITNSGEIVAELFGMQFEQRTAGKMRAVHNAGGRIVVKGTGAAGPTITWEAGIAVFYLGTARADEEGDARSIEIVSAGDIESKALGIVARAYNSAGADKKIPVTIEVTGGAVNAGEHGVYAQTRRYDSGESGEHSEHAGGKITVTVGHGAAVTAGKDGIYVDGALLEGGTRAQTVTVRGTVTGGGEDDDGNKYAGVHMVKGGAVVVGPAARVSAASGTAIKANDEGGMTVILEKDKDGFVGHIDGTVINAGTTVFKTRAGGADTALPAGGRVERRIKEEESVYDTVLRLDLVKIEGGHEFREDKDSRIRLYHPRARLYEALPSVLLDLNARAGSGTAARDGSGGWARVFTNDGERAAESSTTAAGWRGHALVWDIKRQGVEIGYGFPVDETLNIGFSLGRRTVKAAVTRGGGIKAEAAGGTVTLGWRLDSGVHAGGHLSYSRLNGIELSPAGSGAVIETGGGTGISTGAAAGIRTEFRGMTITPRAGLEWSSVKTGGFAEPAAVEGAGEVPEVAAKSLKGTLGARIDMAVGEAGTFWAAADLEHDFKDRTGVTAPGAVLETGMKPTRARLGLGGEFRLSGRMTVSGSAFYAGGGGNKDIGGSLALNADF